MTGDFRPDEIDTAVDRPLQRSFPLVLCPTEIILLNRSLNALSDALGTINRQTAAALIRALGGC